MINLLKGELLGYLRNYSQTSFHIYYSNHYENDSGYLRSSLIGKCICSGSLNRFKSSSTCARLSLRALYRFTSSPNFSACLWNPNNVWRSKTSGKMYSCGGKSKNVKQINPLLCNLQFLKNILDIDIAGHKISWKITTEISIKVSFLI